MPYVNLREWEVRAYLEGRLSKIVRPVKPKPEFLPTVGGHDGVWFPGGVNPRTKRAWKNCRHYGSVEHFRRGVAQDFSPFGKPGDVMVGREAWRVCGGREYEYQRRIEDVRYRADANPVEQLCAEWRPSAHMPAWASRIRPPLLDVSVKLARDVTEEEAREMGHQPLDNEPGTEDHDGSYRAAFAYYLDRDHGPETYDGWVWVGSVGRES